MIDADQRRRVLGQAHQRLSRSLLLDHKPKTQDGRDDPGAMQGDRHVLKTHAAKGIRRRIRAEWLISGKSFGKLAGAAMPITASAEIASAFLPSAQARQQRE